MSCPTSCDGTQCDECKRYWRSVKASARRRPCRCERVDCHECMDRADQAADFKEIY